MLKNRIVMTALWLSCLSATAFADVPPPTSPAAKVEAKELDQLPTVYPHGHAPIDHSGRKEGGRASYYGRSFTHHVMADGHRLNPNANVAASKTLPLGTTAAVTNLENGKTATVKVEDRGPFVDGRVVDLSPKVANELNIKKQGVVPVVVKPIAVPLPDGKIKLGAGAADASPKQIEQATQTTETLVKDKDIETASRR